MPSLQDYKKAYDAMYGNAAAPQEQRMSTSDVMRLASQTQQAYPSSALEAAKSMGLGAIQGIGNLGVSALNIFPSLVGSQKRIPHLNLEQYSNPDYGLHFGAGEFLAPGVGQLGALQKLNRLKRPLGWAGVGSDVARGAALGYLTGENPEGGGRESSAFMQALLSPMTGMTNKELMKKISGLEGKSSKKFSEGFKRVFEEGAKSGASHVTRTKISPIIGRELAFSKASSGRFKKDPSLENAFRLQSDLGKDLRSLESRGLNNFPSEKIRAYHAAKKLQDNLNQSIERAFLTRGRPDLSMELKGLKEAYPSERVPWLDTKIQESLKMHKAGRKPAGRSVRDIASTESFKNELSHQLPELMLKERLKKYGKGAAILGTVGAGGGYVAKKGLLELLEAMKGE